MSGKIVDEDFLKEIKISSPRSSDEMSLMLEFLLLRFPPERIICLKN